MVARQGSAQSLSDAQLVRRALALLVNAADGQRSVSDDREYASLRQQLGKSLDARGLELPGLVATYPTVDALMVYLKGLGPKSARVARVHDDFEHLLAMLGDEVPSPASSSWTGRLTVKELATHVRSLGPLALNAIDDLLAEQEHRHSNGGPVDPEEQAAIDQLKELRSALDDLITAAEADQPLAQQSDRLKSLAARAMGSLASSLRNDMQALPIAGSTVAITSMAFALAGLFAPENAALLIAGTSGTAFATKRVLLPANGNK